MQFLMKGATMLALLTAFMLVNQASTFSPALIGHVLFSNSGAKTLLPRLQSHRVVQSSSLRIKCTVQKDRRQLFRKTLQEAAAISFLTLVPSSKVLAAGDEVKPPSPGVALDMIITMKVAKNMRELESKVEKGKFKDVSSFVTNAFSSGSAKFLRKNKVLSTLATGIKGTASGPDLDSDPAFFNEESPASQKVDAMAEALYAEMDKLEAACAAKDAAATTAAYKAMVSEFDKILEELKLPLVATADPKKIKMP